MYEIIILFLFFQPNLEWRKECKKNLEILGYSKLFPLRYLIMSAENINLSWHLKSNEIIIFALQRVTRQKELGSKKPELLVKQAKEEPFQTVFSFWKAQMERMILSIAIKYKPKWEMPKEQVATMTSEILVKPQAMKVSHKTISPVVRCTV